MTDEGRLDWIEAVNAKISYRLVRYHGPADELSPGLVRPWGVEPAGYGGAITGTTLRDAIDRAIEACEKRGLLVF